MKVIYLIFLCTSLTIISMYLFPWTNVNGQTNFDDFYAGSEPAGRPLSILAQEWWEEFHIPVSDEIPPGECVLGSDTLKTTVFLYDPYLADYNFKCDEPIKSDKYLLIPLMVGECDETLPEAIDWSTIESYWECGKNADELFASWKVTLDNEIIFKSPVRSIIANDQGVNSHLKEEILVRNSPFFNLTVSDANKYQIPNGTYSAIVDGYYLPLKPLPPGEHVLEYESTHIPQEGTDKGKWFYGKVSYLLNVTG